MATTETCIFIEGTRENDGCYSFSIETLLIIYVYKYSKANFNLYLKCVNERLNDSISLDISRLNFTQFNGSIPKIATYCTWPIIIVQNRVVSGLCAVARQIIKSGKNDFKQLLGFRESCLVACSESSNWTKFCEIDMPNCLKKLLKNIDNIKITIPEEFSLLEQHLSQPVNIHNIYKLVEKSSREIPKEQLELPHTYVEGPFITLSDILLFPCVKIMFDLIQNNEIEMKFPLLYNWYETLKISTEFELMMNLPKLLNCKYEINFEASSKITLYKSRNSRNKSIRKMYTNQNKIEKALEKIQNFNVGINNSNSLFGFDIDFNWNSIPLDLNPCGGSLPESRASRKCEQLESMVKSILKILTLRHHKVIVDFCSGSGHLGLILAYLLPNCHVILVENKEKSLDRAFERVTKLNLINLTIIQSNLDYFHEKFDLGVSLHACGAATDLVMKTCMENHADFVCCPCCYGAIKDNHIVDYPRSRVFKKFPNFSVDDFISLAHCADQTHDLKNVKTQQGYDCMNVIDTDRKLYAEEFGYNVFLGKLHPVDCTNKNNLIVGIRKCEFPLNSER